jgi:hypothetical protein
MMSFTRAVRPASSALRAARSMGIRAASKHTLPELPYAYDVRLPSPSDATTFRRIANMSICA